jgi:hypothetical protein
MQHSRLNFIDFLAFPVLTGPQTRRLKDAASLCVVFLLCWSLISSVAQAQESAVKWGKKIKREKKGGIATVVYADQNAVYAQNGTLETGMFKAAITKKFEYTINAQKFDNKLNLVTTTEVPIRFKGEHSQIFSKSIYLGKTMLYITPVYSEGFVRVFAQKLDITTGQLIGEMKEVAKFEQEDKHWEKSKVGIYESEDRNRIAIVFMRGLSKRNAGQNHQYLVILNNKLEQEANKLLSVGDADIMDGKLGNNGDFHFITYYDSDEDNKKYKNINKNLTVYTFQLAEVKLVYSEIKWDTDDFFNAGIEVNSNKNLIAVVALAKEKSKSVATGMAIATFENDARNPIITKVSPFTPEFIGKFFKSTTGNVESMGIYPLNIILYEDGTIQYIGFEYILAYLQNDVGSSGHDFQHLFKDIVVIQIKPNGSIDYEVKAPAILYSFGFHMRIIDKATFQNLVFVLEAADTYPKPSKANKLHLYYTDYDARGFGDPKMSRFVETVIDETGNVKNNEMFTARNLNLISMPAHLRYLNNKIFLTGLSTDKMIYKSDYTIGSFTPSP